MMLATTPETIEDRIRFLENELEKLKTDVKSNNKTKEVRLLMLADNVENCLIDPTKNELLVVDITIKSDSYSIVDVGDYADALTTTILSGLDDIDSDIQFCYGLDSAIILTNSDIFDVFCEKRINVDLYFKFTLYMEHDQDTGDHTFKVLSVKIS